MTRKIALVTCALWPQLTADDLPLIPLLRAHSIVAQPVVWNDPSVPWSEFDLLIVRSTWDYHRRFADFAEWIDRREKETRVLNPPEILRWNTRKSYLSDLASRGVPVVPTHWLPDLADLPQAIAASGWKTVVVKPQVSAAADNTFVLHPGDPSPRPERAEPGGWMLQPYLQEVERAGERSLVFLDGNYSHAVRRKAALNPRAGLVDGTPVVPSPGERAAAEVAYRAVGVRLLYARVDLVTTDDGVARLMELELVEPSLYLGSAPGADQRFANAIAARMGES